MNDTTDNKLGMSLVAALAGVWMSANVWAMDEDAYFSELPIVASVSRLPQRLADAPAAVTVVDRDMIKASGARDLNDIFRLVPGFQTYPNNTESARATYHGMGDGDYSSRVQVLIDGRSMYSPLFGGGVNWATLPVALEDIERIEVVRGTNAVSYGSNAFLGVVNIVTVDPALVRGFSVSSSYGNQNVRDYGFRMGGKIGEVGDFRFTYKQQNDDGLTNRYDWIDSYFSRLFDLRADLVLSDRDSVQFGMGTVDGIIQNGRYKLQGGIWQDNPENPMRQMRQSDTYAQVIWRRVFSADSDIQFRYSYVVDRSDDAFAIFGLHINQSGDEGKRHEFEAQHSFKIDSSIRVGWGGGWREDAMRSDWSLPGMGEVRRSIGRVFGNLEWRPSRWFTGNAGLALEDDSFAGMHVSPRVSSNFHLTPENTIRLGYSRAYHTGSTVDYRGQQRAFGVSYYSARPDLMATEGLDTLEVGYLGDWRERRASLDVRVFSERIRNRLYKIDMNTTNPLIGLSTVPIQDVEIQGVEYQFKWQPFDTTRLTFTQTLANISSDYLASALALSNSTLTTDKAIQIRELTERSMPARSTSVLLIQKLPLGLEFSTAGYWLESMKWSTNTTAQRYRRFDMRLGYPFRSGGLAGEIALTVQSLNGAHNEYKGPNPDDTTPNPDGRIVERRQWVSLRLDF